MNLLKLPDFKDDAEILKTKLLYAIESESGFELSWNIKKNAVMMKLGLIKFFLFHSFATRGGNWVQILKTKLLYAIESESGFELSWNIKKMLWWWN